MKISKKAATLDKPKKAKTLKAPKIKASNKGELLATKVKKSKKQEASGVNQAAAEPELAAIIKELQAANPEKNKANKNKAHKVKKLKNAESQKPKKSKAAEADLEPESKVAKKAKIVEKATKKEIELKPAKVKKLKKQEDSEGIEPVEVKKVKGLKALEKKTKAIKLAIGKPKTKVAKKQAEKATAKKTKKKKDGDMDIESLKKIDPEFYDFLKKNDKKLLEFNAFDSDDDDDEEDDEEDQKVGKEKEAASDADDDDDEKFHKPKEDLEVASDESDFEDGEDEQMAADGTVKITLNLLRQWQLELEKPNPSIDIVRKAIQAFNSALASIAAEADELKSTPTAFKVVGAAAFNGVIQLCVLHLQPALIAILGIQPRSKMPLQKCKKWVKVRGCLRYYLTDLIRLIDQVSSANILSVLLKHLHQMAGMVAPFTALGKTILKRLIVIWGQAEEHIRVLAFVCILKITRNQQGTMLHHVLKAMYLSYVRNSKFVSPNTLPAINFMRRSLTEMFALDLNVAYQHAFLYIRQLAIHLRNAVILKKKDSFQAVYNWQYVNSIRLWTSLLSTTANKPQLQPLVYPLVTITMGVVRLIPTAQYFPLRFHCIQSLITLAKGTHTYIPLMPLILEVLRSTTFNKKHTTVSMRPLQFTCILRLNKGQLAENGMRDEVVEQVVGLSLEYLAHQSASLAFTDLVVPAVMALKAYLKQCRNANYSRKLKQLLDKIQENSRFIEQERRKINFGLKDMAQVQAWETQVRNKGTPLDIYYNSWVKTHETKKRRQASQADTINSDYDVPVVKKPKKKTTLSIKNEQGEVELFPSDSEDEGEVDRLPVDDDDEEDEEIEEKVKPKTKKEKKPKKAKQAKETIEPEVPIEEPGDENVDIVRDLDMDDW